MNKLQILSTALAGCLIIEPTVFGDSRGYFMETYNQHELKEAGLDVKFVQDNESRSQQGVLRGLHFQYQYPQGKLVRVTHGDVYDVAVDLRPASATFGQWVGVTLSGENHRQFYIPEGFAHGFLVLSEYADFVYKCTNYYHPEDEGGIIWNDPDIGITWPIDKIEPLLSDKDQKLKTLQEIKTTIPASWGGKIS